MRPGLGRGHGRIVPDGAADASAFVAAYHPADARALDGPAFGVAGADVRDGGADAEAHVMIYILISEHIKEPPRGREEKRVAEDVLDRGIQRAGVACRVHVEIPIKERRQDPQKPAHDGRDEL